MTDHTHARADESEGDDGISRRTLIRLLVGLGFGIPIAIEGLTFLGLLNDRLLGGGDDGDGNGASTSTPEPSGVGIGETFLPETEATETLADGVVSAGSDRWTVRLHVAVDNGGAEPYVLEVSTLYLADGTEIDGRSSTGRIPPGESGELTGAWAIPSGSTPAALDATVTVGETETDYRVELGKIPVEG